MNIQHYLWNYHKFQFALNRSSHVHTCSTLIMLRYFLREIFDQGFLREYLLVIDRRDLGANNEFQTLM